MSFHPPRVLIAINIQDPQKLLYELYHKHNLETLDWKLYKVCNHQLQRIRNLACLDWWETDTSGVVQYFPRTPVMVIIVKRIDKCYSCPYNPYRNSPCLRYIPWCEYQNVYNWLNQFEPGYSRFLRYFYPTNYSPGPMEKIFQI